MNNAHPDDDLQSLLQDCPVLKLTLRDRDYGMPCPEDRWQVKAAIDELLKPTLEGMVLDLDVVDETADDVLIIGVVDLDAALPKLCDLLKKLHLPFGTTLVLDGSEENLVTDLPTRDELVRQMTEHMIQVVMAECVECAPSDWKGGVLTIQYDGNWLGYQLKNAQSSNSATISGRLRQMCEAITMFIWRNGNRWREAVLQYEGKNYTINFSYDEPLHPIPPGNPTS